MGEGNELPNSTAFSTRIGDHQFALGMKRYEHKEYEGMDYLWKFYISQHPGGNPVLSIIPTVKNLIEIKNFCDKAMAYLQRVDDTTPRSQM